MESICGVDNFLSPAAKVGRDEEAGYILYTAWNMGVGIPATIASESDFSIATVNRCLGMLADNGFIDIRDGLILVNDIGDRFLRVIGFEKQNATADYGWLAHTDLHFSNISMFSSAQGLSYSGSPIIIKQCDILMPSPDCLHSYVRKPPTLRGGQTLPLVRIGGPSDPNQQQGNRIRSGEITKTTGR